jgi:DNA ligase (NAD+)
MDAGLLRFPGDLFRFGDPEWEAIASLPGWGEKSCNNLRASVRRVANTGISLNRFIYSLGIRHVGKHSSELVASAYGTVRGFFEEIEMAVNYLDGSALSETTLVNSDDNADESKKANDTVVQQRPFHQLCGKLGIGPVMIKSLISFSQTDDLVLAAKNLSKSIMVLDEEDVGTSLEEQVDEAAQSPGSSSTLSRRRPWKGFRVVFTGSLDGLTRSEAQKLAKQLGAKATPGSVSKSTDLVVFGDKGGKKLDQARTLGISTMPAEDFLSLARDCGFVDEGEKLG